MKRDQKVLERVHNLTLSFLAAGSLDFQGTDAASLAIDLKLDRSNVSRILNDLWKDKLLIKILEMCIRDRNIIAVIHIKRSRYPQIFAFSAE